ncbi:GntR family transcriptional regulator [Paraburkholderia elongata]|uniref:FCD domain-containing protein n=1 Tax=Paraburkholderia elongata TaxID=2675747 RepID=A0A972NMG5_9BURK|nr:FCD domain-containing protein [Paraburkholderia elongata]NPT55621.1 FCD domain-containing protein [Paraburkholderia elongata]
MTVDAAASQIRERNGMVKVAATRARDVYDLIKRDILDCRLQPGAKLRFEELRDRYEVGISPLREALVRLSANGLVVLEDHRGFHVAPVSRADLVDVTQMRIMLECKALAASIKNGDDEWESHVMGAYHFLSKTERFVDDDRILGQDWEERHRDFHTVLLKACGSPWLLQLRTLLYDQSDRYRRLSLRARQQPRPANVEHREILDKVLARDVDAACDLLAKHIQKTTDILLADPDIGKIFTE